MRKKMAAAVLMAAMTASLLAGCGDSKSSDSTKADSAQTTASNQSEAGDSTSDYLFFTMLFNGGLVPTYIMYTRYLHMKNTIPALIIPGLLMSAFNVILTRTYIQSNVPAALSEAAKIDGATEFQVFRKVVLPMCKPIIATVGLFAGLGYWNDWTNGLYYITDTNKFSIQQLLNNMIKNIEFLSKNANSNINLASVGGGIPQETVRMAIAIVGLLPILIVFPFVQKYFVKGISIGAVKG